MKVSDAGYHSIFQSITRISHDVPLPSNPVMITFDDTREEHQHWRRNENTVLRRVFSS
jgi:hypothetical protein